VPLLKFPYLSLLATGGHTEIILNRGVGLHTIIGITIDSSMGQCFDKASNMIKKYEAVLKD
jgi:N6-L-threonylcarbamoyladenine synthase